MNWKFWKKEVVAAEGNMLREYDTFSVHTVDGHVSIVEAYDHNINDRWTTLFTAEGWVAFKTNDVKILSVSGGIADVVEVTAANDKE